MNRALWLVMFFCGLPSFASLNALADDVRPVQLRAMVIRDGKYQIIPTVEFMIPADFERVNYQNSAMGIYYGPVAEVEAVMQAGDDKIPKLNRGVFQVTSNSISSTSKYRLFDKTTKKFILEEPTQAQAESLLTSKIQIKALRRGDTSNFPILISKIELGPPFPPLVRYQVLVSIPDDERDETSIIVYHAPTPPTRINDEIWERFVASIREK